MVTQKIKIILHKVHKDDDYGYLYLRVKIPGKKRYKPKSLGYKVSEKYWDPETEKVLKGFPDYDHINDHVDRKKLELKRELQNVETNGKQVTESIIKDKLKRTEKGGGSFISFFDAHRKYIRSKHSKGYANHWDTEHTRIVTYAGNELSFDEITMEWLKGYETYLREGDHIRKPLAGTTLNTVFKRMKEVIDLAISRGHIQPFQIAGYKFPAYVPPEREYLTLEETDRIFDALPEFDRTLQTVAAFFLIECYAGVRISDWRRFAVERLVHHHSFKVRTKKNGQPVYLPLRYFPRLKKVLNYIEKNNLTIAITDQLINRYLKVIASVCNLSLALTSHVGRHTCGTLLGELGFSTREIAEVLGISEQTAKTYIKQTRKGLTNAFERYGGL